MPALDFAWPALDFAWISWTTVYLVFEWGLRLVMLAVVPLKRSPQAASAWLLLILVLPWAGLLLYLFIGQPEMPAWRKARIRRFAEAVRPLVERLAPASVRQAPALPARQEPVAFLAEQMGRFPPREGNAVDLLTDYEATLSRLARDIDAARHHVHLLYYIFADDEATRPVLVAIERAARRGVACRVLMDALGSRSYVRKLVPRLKAAGAEVHEMLPYGFFRRYRTRLDLRNHRKIAVIDGRTGYTGSQNLVSPKYKKGIVYEELVARVEGPAVLQLQFVFAADWYLETEEVLQGERLFPEPEPRGGAVAQVLPSGPLFETETTQRLIVALLYAARKRVVITTPYFIPDAALLQAMQTAVLRGVSVDLIVSRKMDQLLVGLAQESYYDDLLAVGVRVHRYQEQFLHAKHVSFDDAVVLIGSSNMDIRSFKLNGEISLLVYGEAFARRLGCEQERYLAGAERLTQAAWAERSRARRLAQNLARLMSPLL